MTVVSPGYTQSELTDHGGDLEVRAAVRAAAEQLAIPASAIADAIAYAIAQPDNVDVNELIIRPSADGSGRGGTCGRTSGQGRGNGNGRGKVAA